MKRNKTDYISAAPANTEKKSSHTEPESGFPLRLDGGDSDRQGGSGYHTRQRAQVLDYLRESDGCITAEEIILGLSDRGINISKPTVYRTLDYYVKSGEISRFAGDKGESATYRYGGDSHGEHFHIKCTECKQTVCVDCHFINNLANHFFAHHGFSLSPNQTVFYGICSRCRAVSDGVGL